MNRGAIRLNELFPALLESGKPDRKRQARIAEEVDVDQSTVSRWLSGDRKPDSEMRALLEDLYGIGWRLWDEERPVSKRDSRPLRTASR